MKIYKIIRFRMVEGHPRFTRRVIKRGLTLEQAQAHCSSPETAGLTWFDGYEEE